MEILLFLICYCFLFLAIQHRKPNDFFLNSIKTMLLFSLLVVLSTEWMSAFHHLNHAYLSFFWAICVVILSAYLYFQKDNLNKNQFLLPIKTYYQNNKWLFCFISIISFVLCIQGWVYPPNNWDAMCYHLGRLPHWIAQQSLEHYPTHIYRQVYQPYFSSALMAQIGLLNQSDFWLNSVQFGYYLAIIPCLIVIGNIFHFSRLAKAIAIFFWVTNPESLLQAISPQNDIVVTFFILCSILFAFQSVDNQWISKPQKNILIPFIWLGLSVGLACLSKGTAYIYLAPVFGIAGFVWLKKMIQMRRLHLILPILVMTTLFLATNAGYFYRNYQLTKDVLGKSEDKFFNEKMNAKIFVLQVVKNISLHFGMPGVSNLTNQVVEQLHQSLGEKADDPAVNWLHTTFHLWKWVHDEDTASNFFQILLILGTTVWFMRRNRFKNQSILIILFPVILFILFIITLKWQPWHTRLQMPLFALFALPVAFCLSELIQKSIWRQYLLKIYAGSMIGYAGLIMLFNTNKPFISTRFSSKTNLMETRFQKYFCAKPEVSTDYQWIRNFIQQYEPNTIGIILDEIAWEYPLYFDIFSQSRPTVLPHLNVTNRSAHAKTDVEPTKIHFIIAINSLAQITYMNNEFTKIKQLQFFSIYQKKP